MKRTVEFIGDPQNAHSTEVNHSVTASLKRLAERYNAHSDMLQINLKDIRKKITQLGCGNAEAILDRVDRTFDVHEGSKLTAVQILNLVWIAMHDKDISVRPEDAPKSAPTDEDIVDREKTLINALIGIMSNGGRNPSGNTAEAKCFTGMINDIVGTLDLVHRDVVIATGKAGLERVIGYRVTTLIADKLREKTEDEQEDILSSWETFDLGNCDVKTAADKFRGYMMELIPGSVIEDFKGLAVDESKLKFIRSCVEYAPKPILDYDLREMVQKIGSLPESDNSNRFKSATLINLHKFSRSVISDYNGKNAKDLFASLRKAHETFENFKDFFDLCEDTIKKYESKGRKHGIYSKHKDRDRTIEELSQDISDTIAKKDLLLEETKIDLVKCLYKAFFATVKSHRENSYAARSPLLFKCVRTKSRLATSLKELIKDISKDIQKDKLDEIKSNARKSVFETDVVSENVI